MSKTGRFQETLIDYIDGVLYENLFAMKLALGGVGVISGEIPPAAPGYLIRGVGTNWVVLPIGQEGYVLTVASGLPEWLSIAGGGDQTFRLDGSLIAYSGIGSYVVPRACSLGDVYITCDSPGISGYTIVDINLVRSGVGDTIFTNQANRPILAFDNINGWVKGTPDIKELLEGDILIPDIDEAAEAAEGLVIVSAIQDRGGDADSFTGPETFLELLDTPYSYAEQAGKFATVNNTEGGLEFTAISGDVALAGDGEATVVGLQGRDVSNEAPAADQAIIWDAVTEKWKPQDQQGGGGINVTKKTLQVREVLYDETLTEAGTFDAQNISQECDHLELVASLRSVANDQYTPNMTLNNDVFATNYYVANHYFGSTHGGALYANTRLFYASTANNSPANEFGSIYALIPEYTGGKFKSISSVSSAKFADDSVYGFHSHLVWKATAAINRIALAGSGGENFAAGSRLQIIGIRELDVVIDVEST